MWVGVFSFHKRTLACIYSHGIPCQNSYSVEEREIRLVRHILGTLLITYERILPVRKGYRNASYPVQCADGSIANVILFKNETGIIDKIRRADALSSALAERGMPSRQPLSPIIQLAGLTQRRYARVYTYLPGETIAWEAYSMKHLKQLGSTLSNLHAIASDMPPPAILMEANIGKESLSLCSRMHSYVSSSGVRTAQRSKLNTQIDSKVFDNFSRLLSADRLQSLPHIPLHMDFVRGNILFSETKEISGIIDFEKTSYGPAVFDIARTLAFLLVDCKYKPGIKVVQYFLQSGYLKQGSYQPTSAELQPLKQLTLFFLLHDFYKFLLHNPYESLQYNEHYVRTRDLLALNGIITYSQSHRDDALEPKPTSKGIHNASRLEETLNFAV